MEKGTGTAQAGGAPDFEHMSVHQLKEWLTSHGVDMSGPDAPVEKEDLIDLAKGQHLKASLGHPHPHSAGGEQQD